MVNLMKEEDFENYTDPILEECYRMKEEFNAQFNSVEELSAHLRQVQEECKRRGMKVVSYYVPPEKRKEEKKLIVMRHQTIHRRNKSSTHNLLQFEIDSPHFLLTNLGHICYIISVIGLLWEAMICAKKV